MLPLSGQVCVYRKKQHSICIVLYSLVLGIHRGYWSISPKGKRGLLYITHVYTFDTSYKMLCIQLRV